MNHKISSVEGSSYRYACRCACGDSLRTNDLHEWAAWCREHVEDMPILDGPCTVSYDEGDSHPYTLDTGETAIGLSLAEVPVVVRALVDLLPEDVRFTVIDGLVAAHLDKMETSPVVQMLKAAGVGTTGAWKDIAPIRCACGAWPMEPGMPLGHRANLPCFIPDDRVLSTDPSEQGPGIEALIQTSSLGTPGATKLRAKTPKSVAEDIVKRSERYAEYDD